MSDLEVVRAWKDPVYRAGLEPDLLAATASPVGEPALSDEGLKDASWQAFGVLTTAPTCTEFTFNGWRRCCP
jgi:mersacidin/lichenicidin family type 2 lantibiotic